MVRGDFNRSFTPGTSKSASKTLALDYGQTRKAVAGTEFDLPVYVESAMEVGALSLIMNFPADKLEITGVYLGSNENAPVGYNVNGDELRIGWTDINPVVLKAAERLVTLKVRLTGTFDKEELLRFALAADVLNELADGNAEVIPDARLNIDVIGAFPLGIDVQPAGDLLLANYPNPFNGTTTIAYTLPVAGNVTIEIRDMLGSIVRTPVNNEAQSAGDHRITMDGSLLAPGVYMATLKLNAGGQPLTRTIKILRNH